MQRHTNTIKTCPGRVKRGSVHISGSTDQDANNKLKGSYGPAVERIRKGEDQEYVERSEEYSGPKRKSGKYEIQGNS